MSIGRWLEQKLLGEIVRDYGCIHEAKNAFGIQKTYILLFRRKGRLELAIKTTAIAFCSFSVRYELLPTSVLPELQTIIGDIASVISSEAESSA